MALSEEQNRRLDGALAMALQSGWEWDTSEVHDRPESEGGLVVVVWLVRTDDEGELRTVRWSFRWDSRLRNWRNLAGLGGR